MIVKRRLHGESALPLLIRAQVLIAQVLYSLLRAWRNSHVRVDQPGPIRIDVHVTIDFRDQLSTGRVTGATRGTKCGLFDGVAWAGRTASAAK